jgi:type IV pilus assembly protein PilN
MPRINLLPWREAQRKQRRQEFFMSLGAAVATAALVILLGRWQMSSAIEHQQARNQILND